MKFHEKLQKLRKEKGMSQENLGEILNVSRQSISKWESGGTYPEMEKLIALSEIFGVTLDNLVKDNDINENADNTANDHFWVNRNNSFEYKSKKIVFGMPLVHINIGFGRKKAKGIIAIGNIASGLVSIGFVSFGLISMGLVSIGLLSFGIIAIGALLAAGAISVGTISFGAIALGIFATGAISAGMFSIGAISAATHIAIGNHASGTIAIGEVVDGIKTIQVEDTNHMFSTVTSNEVKNLINSQFPNMWKWIVDLISGFFK